jgi:hypothetical protein
MNEMQANLGLFAGGGGPTGLNTPDMGSTTQALVAASMQRHAMMQQQSSMGAFANQFQQQFSGIQQSQSMSPYWANHLTGGGYGRYLPSPLTMTPAHTGVFRPPAETAFAAIPPTPLPPLFATPFTPRIPTPVFRTPYEQQLQIQDHMANRIYSGISQVPGVLGTATGFGAGALAGAAFGSRFGGVGALVGAGVGGLFAGVSGFASGVGDIAQRLVQPSLHRHQMGAAIQDMSRSWLVSGREIHGMGQGFSRDASLKLAGEVQSMAGDAAFKSSTGGLFSSTDLMRVLRQGGEAGLFDMSQSVDTIKKQLKTTATTIRAFMQLTNDPDITSVIQEMGRLRQFGLSTKDMAEAAQGMRAFSRAAGTTIQGLQSIGGLPGAMTFQQAGLTAGQGFMYGNYAAASARQLVASGSINERQLALLGGVSGITQRDIQAQAALASMPLFAASNMQYGVGGWGVNYGNVGNVSGGATGMVLNASAALNQAVARGGLGALASFSLSQREMADKAMSALTPQQQMAQRFLLAQQTGQQLWLEGVDALNLGARRLFGDEVAEQMMYQAKDPAFWRSQRDIIKRQKEEIHQSRILAERANERMLPDWLANKWDSLFIDEKETEKAGTIRRKSPKRYAEDIFDSFTSWVSDQVTSTERPFKNITDFVSDFFAADEGVAIGRVGASTGRVLSGLQDKDTELSLFDAGSVKKYERLSTGDELSSRRLSFGSDATRRAAEMGGYSANVGRLALETGASVVMPLVGTAAVIALRTFGNVDEGKLAGAGVIRGDVASMRQTLSEGKLREIEQRNTKDAREQYELVRRGHKLTTQDLLKAYTKLDLKGDSGAGLLNLEDMGANLDKIFLDKSGGGDIGIKLSDADYLKAMVPVLQKQYNLSYDEATKRASEMLGQPDVKAAMIRSAREQTDEGNKARYTKELETEVAGLLYGGDSVTGTMRELKTRTDSLRSDLGMRESTANKLDVITGKYGADTAKLAAVAHTLRTGDRSKERELNLSAEELMTYRSRVSKLGEDEIKSLSRLGEQDLTKVAEWGQLKQVEGIQAAFKSSGFRELISKYSSDVGAYLDSTDDVLDAKTIVDQFSDEDIARLSKGTANERRMASLVMDVRKGGPTANRSALALQRMAIGAAEIDAEGKDKHTGSDMTDKTKLDASDDALAAVEALVSTFTPAAQEFKDGARLLREAMVLHDFKIR